MRHVVWALGESFSISFVLFDTKQISTGSKLWNTRHPKRSEAQDAMCLELQVNHYHLTPLGQTGASQAQVSFPFPHYYFINNFILLQTKLLLYNSSIMVAPPQSQHRHKQGAGRGKSKEMAGEGNRGSRRIASWAQVHFFLFFFLISLIKYVNRYYSAMTLMAATSTLVHHHHTYITSDRKSVV